MESFRAPGRRFYCCPPSNEVEGPFELVELVGLLRAKHITAETPTLVEGEEQWLQFQDRPEFLMAQEIPNEAIVRHVQEKVDAQVSSAFSPRKLLVFVWIMAPVFLYVLYRFVRLYLFYHLAHGTAPTTDSIETPGGS